MQKKQKIKATGKRQALPCLARENEKVAGYWNSLFNYLSTKHTFSLLPALKSFARLPFFRMPFPALMFRSQNNSEG